MCSLKILRYYKGGRFNPHGDSISMPDTDDYTTHVKTLDGSVAPSHVNREMTFFVYLRDAERGGETAFYRSDHEGEQDFYLKIKPQQGLAVLFYPTMQPPRCFPELLTQIPPGISVERRKLPLFDLIASEDISLIVLLIWPHAFRCHCGRQTRWVY